MARRDRGSAWRFILPTTFLVFTALTALAVFQKDWAPPVASEHGQGVDAMVKYIMGAAGLIFVVGHLLLAKFIWSSGKEDGPGYKAMGHTSEMWLTLGPTVFILIISEIGTMVIGAPVWAKVYDEKPDDVQIEIVSMQYEWIGHYPGRDGKYGPIRYDKFDAVDNVLALSRKDVESRDDLSTRGKIVMPVGKPCAIRIRSYDVLHSFNVPAFRTKQDAVPGSFTRTRIIPTKVGTFEIACAQICGPGHYKMRAIVEVKTLEDFNKWLTTETGYFE